MSFTPFGQQLRNTLEEEHSSWREKQLLGEVLKFQLQQEAAQNFYKLRDNDARGHDLAKHQNTMHIYSSTSDILVVELTLVRAVINDLYTQITRSSMHAPSISSSYTLRLLFDTWSCNVVSSETCGIDGQIVWNCESVSFAGALTMEAVRRGGELKVELHDNGSLGATLVATGSCRITSLLQSGN